MFWGISCDSGKRYSQNVNASYHVSMASLETRDSSYAKKAVRLMVEHKNNEFLLCTLQYERCMQVNLDLLFKKGEDVTFFLNGPGTVHLTGYLIEDDDDSVAPPPSDDGVQIMEGFEDSSIAISQDKRKSREHLKRSSLPTGNSEILEGDDSDDDDDSDYVPTKDNSKKKNERDKPEVNGRKADMDESDDDDDDAEDEEDDVEDEEGDVEEGDDDEKGDDDEEDDEEENEEQQEEKVSLTNKKRKVQTTSGNDSKRIKKANSTDPQTSKDVAKNSKGQTPNVKESIPTISVEDEEDEDEEKEEEESDDEDSDEDSNEADEEDMESSIGRTPMPPKRKESVKKTSQVQMKLDFVPSPSATKNSTEKAKEPSVKKIKKKKKDHSINALEKSFGKKLEGGVEIEDLRIGNGPMAKITRMAHIYYVGRLPNNTIFDSSSDGKKPFAFRLGRGEVIKGLDVGMEGMKVGGKRKIKIPPNMGYGKKPNASIPGNSTLYFTVELKAIT